jgi:hypothetical protein
LETHPLINKRIGCHLADKHVKAKAARAAKRKQPRKEKTNDND